MVNNTIHATYTETYDLNTAVDEVSLLAIHTPQATALKRMFKGFFENYKKYRILGCNLKMVCASQQSLTPDLVGLESGQVDPRDVLNPILFKACTGENLDPILNVIYNRGEELGATNQYGSNVDSSSVGQHTSKSWESLKAYYSYLADDTFRKSHPQAGLTVTGLVPMVHKVVTTQPFKWTGVNATPLASGAMTSRPVIVPGSDYETAGSVVGFGSPNAKFSDGGTPGVYDATNPSVFVSNGVTPMPWLDTVCRQTLMGAVLENEGTEASPLVTSGNYVINDVPRVYMGCIILPPAILQRLFFRMTIVWHVQFRDFRPAFECGPLNRSAGACYPDDTTGINNYYGDTAYYNMYHSATPTKDAVDVASGFGKETSSFTTTENTEVETVFEKVA